MSRREISRRRFLTIAGAAGASLLACGALGTVALYEPSLETMDTKCGAEKEMERRILVAYASKCGSTAEVAEAVGQVLCQAGAAVEVRAVQEVADLTPYRAVVLGSAIRMGRPLSEAARFAQKHQAALAGLPFALFSLGTTMSTDTPKNRSKAEGFLQPIVQLRQPASIGLFGGKVDPARLPFFWRLATSQIKDGDMAPGDHRNWEAIRAWAEEIAPLLLQG